MDDDNQIVAGCLATIQTLRIYTHSTLTIRHLEILLYIYLHEGITRQRLQEFLPELSESSIRRYIEQLGKVQWKESYAKAQGIQHNLIREIRGDDSRYKHLYLNESGRKVILMITEKMRDSMKCLELPQNLTLITNNRIN